MAKIPARKQVNKKYTWNAESVFKTVKEWEAALKAVIADIPNVKKYEGKLGESPETLLAGIKAIEDLSLRAQTVFMYAQFAYAVDTTNQASGALVGKAQGMFGQVSAAISFLNPELLYIGREKLEEWMKANASLAVYRQSIDDLFRQQAHVRSVEVEEILGMTADPFSGPSSSTGMLVNADFKFAPAKDSKGKKIEITQGNFYSTLLEHPDRKVTTGRSSMDVGIELRRGQAKDVAITASETDERRMPISGSQTKGCTSSIVVVSLAVSVFIASITSAVQGRRVACFMCASKRGRRSATKRGRWNTTRTKAVPATFAVARGSTAQEGVVRRIVS